MKKALDIWESQKFRIKTTNSNPVIAERDIVIQYRDPTLSLFEIGKQTYLDKLDFL